MNLNFETNAKVCRSGFPRNRSLEGHSLKKHNCTLTDLIGDVNTNEIKKKDDVKKIEQIGRFGNKLWSYKQINRTLGKLSDEVMMKPMR